MYIILDGEWIDEYSEVKQEKVYVKLTANIIYT